MYTLPAPATATPDGVLRFALVPAPPSPQTPFVGLQAVPVPALVVIVPPGVSLRTRLSLASAMYTLPAPSTATPTGSLRFALVPAPPSPQAAVAGLQAVPVPAIVVIVPPGVSLRTRWSLVSAMY